MNKYKLLTNFVNDRLRKCFHRDDFICEVIDTVVSFRPTPGYTAFKSEDIDLIKN